jgi:hypothetical protein
VAPAAAFRLAAPVRMVVWLGPAKEAVPRARAARPAPTNVHVQSPAHPKTLAAKRARFRSAPQSVAVRPGVISRCVPLAAERSAPPSRAATGARWGTRGTATGSPIDAIRAPRAIRDAPTGLLGKGPTMTRTHLISALLISLVVGCGGSRSRPTPAPQPVDPAKAPTQVDATVTPPPAPADPVPTPGPACALMDMRCRDKTTIDVCTAVGGVPAWEFRATCPLGCGRVGTTISCCDGCTVGETKNCDKITKHCDECVVTEPGCSYWLRR